MILSGKEISSECQSGRILIDPWDEKQVNPNSYNLRLGETLLQCADPYLDAAQPGEWYKRHIAPYGCMLHPHNLYLGHTIEYVGSDYYVPEIVGRSSIGRLGLTVHITAGFGDVGFKGQWTLEITCVRPIIIYAGMEICQVFFHELKGRDRLYCGKYQCQNGAQSSLLYHEL